MQTTSKSENDAKTVSNMSYVDMVGFYHQQVSRVEMAWFRIMYLHAALVGVLIFFEQAEEFFVFQRVIVFGFYTVNLAIFFMAFKDGYVGLTAAEKDLKLFPGNNGNVDGWFRSRNTKRKTELRVLIMFITWSIVGILLFGAVTPF